MSDLPERDNASENEAKPVKKSRTVNPGGKKRGPKPRPVNKKIRVRDMEEHETPLPEPIRTNDPIPARPLSYEEQCEYVEITVMEDPSESREVVMNNGMNRPITFIRGFKCIIPMPYVWTMDEINKIQVLKHEPIDGSSFREYYVPMMRFNYIIHRKGLTYLDYKAQMDSFKLLRDPWSKVNQNFPSR